MIYKIAIQRCPAAGSVADLKDLENFGAELSFSSDVVEGGFSGGLAQGVFVELGGDGEDFVELFGGGNFALVFLSFGGV